MKPARLIRTRAPALAAAVTATVASALLTAPSSAIAVTDPAAALPEAVPITEVEPGLTATGLTVSKGNTPEPFAVTVLGVLPDGIGAGLDMIVFEADSPALDAAGGIWSGMSGSPVHTDDGRLLGVVAYGFTYEPSKVGGMTPGEAVLELLDNPDAPAARAPERVPLPPALRHDLAARGEVTAAQAAAGLSPLLVPLSVSGLSATRLAQLNSEFERQGSRLRAYSGAAASGAPAAAGSIFAGSNFVAATSYGDVTLAKVGTATLVHNGRVLAFGHPLTFAGPVTMSAHQADALTVVRDAYAAPFKMVTVGDVAGTVDQDRMAGVRATLGAGPSGTVPVTSTVRSGTRERTATTWVTVDSQLADVAMLHVLVNIDRVLDEVGDGRAEVSWLIRGTKRSGAAWQVSRTNRYASRTDISRNAVAELDEQIKALVNNPFVPVKITDVLVTATAWPDYDMYAVEGLQEMRDGAWVDLTDNAWVTPGQPLELRVRLRDRQGTTRFVRVALDPPAPPHYGGFVSVAGRYSEFPWIPPVTSFAELLATLRGPVRNNHLVIQLQLETESGIRLVKRTINLDETVTGEHAYLIPAAR